jgi:hypothetical protein
LRQYEQAIFMTVTGSGGWTDFMPASA